MARAHIRTSAVDGGVAGVSAATRSSSWSPASGWWRIPATATSTSTPSTPATLRQRARIIRVIDGDTLIVGETFAGRLTAFTIAPDGTIAKVYVGVNAARNAGEVMADIESFGFPDDVAFARHLVREAGVAAAVSGAGPTVLALPPDGVVPPRVDTTGFDLRRVSVDLGGVRVAPLG